jgi:hypothetical protein
MNSESFVSASGLTQEEALVRARRLFGKEGRVAVGKQNDANPSPKDPTDPPLICMVGKVNEGGRVMTVFGKGETWEQAVHEAEINVAGNVGDTGKVMFLKHSF